LKNKHQLFLSSNPETESRQVRLVFAKNQTEAEKLLTTPREGMPIINED